MKSKFKFLTIAVILLISVISCSKEETIINIHPDATLIIQLDSMKVDTRSTGNADNGYQEARIQNALIAVFYKDGTVNSIRKATFGEGRETVLEMKVRSGHLDVYVVANTTLEETAVTGKETLLQLTEKLSQNPASVLMSGITQIEAVAGEVVRGTVNLKRVVGKISVEYITDNLANNGYTNHTAKIKAVFVHNSPTVSSLFEPLVTSDVKKYSEHADFLNLSPNYYGYDTRHFFYVFEGTNKIVIQAEINGKNYYYPKEITVKRNTHYKLRIEIKGLGGETPDTPYEESATFKVTLAVDGWEFEEDNHSFN